jgi:outer membrane receptor protein involved in Fe transport
VNDTGLNTAACATITRNGFIGAGDPNNFKMTSFIQGSLNYASTLAKGIDFAGTAAFDLKELTGLGLGDLEFRLRGNYLIKQQDFVNISVPSAASNFDGTVGLPRLRALLTTTWLPTDTIRLIWDIDWQAEQEIIDNNSFDTNPDQRDRRYAETTPFVQNDFTISIDVRENMRLRAGVVNMFDAEPDKWLGSTTTADNFDFFGRRFFVGFNYKY